MSEGAAPPQGIHSFIPHSYRRNANVLNMHGEQKQGLQIRNKEEDQKNVKNTSPGVHLKCIYGQFPMGDGHCTALQPEALEAMVQIEAHWDPPHSGGAYLARGAVHCPAYTAHQESWLPPRSNRVHASINWIYKP